MKGASYEAKKNRLLHDPRAAGGMSGEPLTM